MPYTQYTSYAMQQNTYTPPECPNAITSEQEAIFHELIGCGGAHKAETFCPAGSYCPNSTTREICPKGYSCREGVSEPHPCSFLQACPRGSESPQNDTVTASVFTVGVIFIIIGLVFYDKLKTYGLIAFNLMYKAICKQDFEEVRVERNKKKKENVSTLFSSQRNLNFRPYKTVDVEQFRESLLATELEETHGDTERSAAMSVASSMSEWTDFSSDEKEERTDPSKLKFFMVCLRAFTTMIIFIPVMTGY